jgi:hypothetical protein
MKAGKQGEWKRVAQECAEARAERLARMLWLTHWKKFDRQRRQSKPKN